MIGHAVGVNGANVYTFGINMAPGAARGVQRRGANQLGVERLPGGGASFLARR